MHVVLSFGKDVVCYDRGFIWDLDIKAINSNAGLLTIRVRRYLLECDDAWVGKRGYRQIRAGDLEWNWIYFRLIFVEMDVQWLNY